MIRVIHQSHCLLKWSCEMVAETHESSLSSFF